MYDIERFYRAKDVPDAVRALEADPDAMLISGGTDVLIQTREGKLAGCSLVSINQLPELMGIRIEEDGTIVIGGAATFSDITNNKALQSRIPILCWAVDQVGSPQIRNVGTIGGNVSNGVTSADSASSLFALNAVVELTGPDGVRRLPIADYYAGPGKTVRQHSEILTAIRDVYKRQAWRIRYGYARPAGRVRGTSPQRPPLWSPARCSGWRCSPRRRCGPLHTPHPRGAESLRCIR